MAWAIPRLSLNSLSPSFQLLNKNLLWLYYATAVYRSRVLQCNRILRFSVLSASRSRRGLTSGVVPLDSHVCMYVEHSPSDLLDVGRSYTATEVSMYTRAFIRRAEPTRSRFQHRAAFVMA